MAVLKILKFPDAHLRSIAQEVNNIDNVILLLITDLIETMLFYDALGIAATQTNNNKRIIVINMSNNYIFQPFVLINPQILSFKDISTNDEGCLSFPNIFVNVKRRKKIYIKFFDINGVNHFLKADDMLSICLQHEIDHINGITIYDRVTNLKKKMILKKLS